MPGFSSGMYFRSAIRDAVTVAVAGIITAREDIVDNPHGVTDINSLVAVTISRFQRIRGITAGEDIIDDLNGVADINHRVTIGVPANIGDAGHG